MAVVMSLSGHCASLNEILTIQTDVGDLLCAVTAGIEDKRLLCWRLSCPTGGAV